jgi:hypothetical protein
MSNWHDWEFLEGATIASMLGRHAYSLWARYKCKSCGTLRCVTAGLAFYEPPGEDIVGFGQLAPSCHYSGDPLGARR